MHNKISPRALIAVSVLVGAPASAPAGFPVAGFAGQAPAAPALAPAAMLDGR